MSGSNFTLTPNLQLYKPTYLADGEQWGMHLNLNADTLDSALSGGLVIAKITVGTLNISSIPLAQSDGSPPIGAVKGDLYNNGGFVCIAP